MARKENDFQAKLIKEIKARFPGALVLKNDPNYLQGFPDLTVLWSGGWALLECKRNADAPHQANQDFYIKVADGLSFGRFIHPENMEAILNEMERAFKVRR